MQDTHVLDSLKVDSFSQSQAYTIFIDEDVAESTYYRNVLKVLSMANENDTIRMIFDTHGGFGSTAMTLAHAMDNCRAEITGVLASNCMSAGTILALHCHKWEIGNGLSFMVHTASFGVGGEAPKVAKRHDFEQKQIKDLLYREYSGFYSAEEISAIADGNESWLNAEEVSKRLEDFQLYKQKQHREYHQAIEDSMWAENNQVIDETLETLDFSDKEKEVFNKVRKALDDALMEGEEDDPVMESFLKYLEDKEEQENIPDTLEDSDNILKNIVDTEGDIVGYVEFKNTEEDGEEFLLGTEIVLTSWDEELIFSEEVVEDNKTKCLELLHTITDKKFNKANRQRIYTSVLKYLTDVLDN